MPANGVCVFLVSSIVLGLIVAWRVALKHRAVYALMAGVFVIVVLYGLLFLRASHLVAEAIKSGCWEWCGELEYVLYGAMAVIAVIMVLIGGSLIAILVQRRRRLNQTST